MVLFTIVLGLIIVAAVLTLGTALITSGSLLLVFGDVIVFGLIVAAIIKLFRKKKK